MLQILFKKWWVILLQGILLIILSIFIFNNPTAVLAGLSLWFTIIVIITGLAGIISWFGAGKYEKDGMSLLWSVITCLFGLLMAFNLLDTMKIITLIFGLWVLMSAVFLFRLGWSLKNDNTIGWILLVAGGLSVAIAVMMLFNIGIGVIAISTLLGLQVIFTGISLVLLSFAKKKLAGVFSAQIGALK